jgi:hypothetical protein
MFNWYAELDNPNAKLNLRYDLNSEVRHATINKLEFEIIETPDDV